jgi:histidinol-phosphate aminotransferase
MPKINSHILNINRTTPTYSDLNKIRLHASERDDPYTKEVWEDYLSRVKSTDMMYYPNIDDAYNVLEKFSGISKSNLTLYDGSSNGIRNLFSVFVQPNSTVISTNPAFPMYKVYAELSRAEYVEVEYTDQYFPEKNIISAINERTSVVIISNPSSPVGDIISKTTIMTIIDACSFYNVLLVIDEAYIEFSNATSFAHYATNYDNVIVLRTFSKAYGSAGARIGYSVSTEKTCDLLDNVRSMNEISSMSIKWMETLYDHRSIIDSYISAVKHNRKLLQAYYSIHGKLVICSQTNFIHVSNLLLPEEFIYKKCKMPWSNIEFSRLSIPANKATINKLLSL